MIDVLIGLCLTILLLRAAESLSARAASPASSKRERGAP